MVVDVLLHHIKDQAPELDQMPFDLPVESDLEFEDLAGLFAGTTLDESLATMNIRQTAYLFGLVRRMEAAKVIEVGRHFGASTLVIAAAMGRKGRLWSIEDPQRIHEYADQRGRTLSRPVEDQVVDVARRFKLNIEPIAGDSRSVEFESGEVDLVFIDGIHAYEVAMSDFERFGMRVRVGGAVLLDDAVKDEFHEPAHTSDVKRVAECIAARPDFRLVKTVRRLAHFERVH